jgi:hypothetical protein
MEFLQKSDMLTCKQANRRASFHAEMQAGQQAKRSSDFAEL